MPKRSWFDGLTANAVRALSAAFHNTTAGPGSILFSQGDRPLGFYWVREGIVKLTAYKRRDRPPIVRMVSRRETVGVSALLMNEPQPATAETMTRCKLAFLRREDSEKLEQIFPDSRPWVTRLACRESERQRRYDDALSGATAVHQQVAFIITEMARTGARYGRQNGKIVVSVTQENLAFILRCRRETINRGISTLKGFGLIAASRGSIEILQPRKLRAMWC